MEFTRILTSLGLICVCVVLGMVLTEADVPAEPLDNVIELDVPRQEPFLKPFLNGINKIASVDNVIHGLEHGIESVGDLGRKVGKEIEQHVFDVNHQNVERSTTEKLLPVFSDFPLFAEFPEFKISDLEPDAPDESDLPEPDPVDPYCNVQLKKDLETQCDATYDIISTEAEDIDDEWDRTETICCALEDLERCSLRAYDESNCGSSKPALRENLKAARLFLSVLSNVSCSAFRGRCRNIVYSSAPVHGFQYSLIPAVIFVLFVFLSSLRI